MNKQKIEQFRKILVNQLAGLRKDLETTQTDPSHDEEVYADWSDVASIETDKNMKHMIRGRDLMSLGELENAIKRIEAGTFGHCERCEELISEQRLKARPTTTLCIDCKSELEGIEQKHRYPM